MKNKKWIGVLGIIGILLNILPFGAFTSVSADSVIQDGGTFYQDVPEAANSPLGAAQYFHIFANDVTLRTHTNGNIAAKNFNGGNANFGTNGYLDKEYFYLDNVQSINGNSGITGEDHNKLVVGASVSVDISNPNRPKINDTNMDHLTASQIYQDQGTNQYINFTEEMERLSNASQKITSATPDLTFSASDFPDRNNRVIDVSSINKSAVFITLSADVLQTGTPLNIAGLEKGYDCSEVKSVFITVDTEGQDVYNSNSQINLSYTDGSERHNHEATDFSDSTILWNFTSMGTPYNGTVTIQSPWQGSILAPKATIDGSGVNIDGSIIADKFLGAGETHRWDWHGCFHSEEVGSVLLTKTDAKDQTKVLAGAEFSLYNSDGKLIKDGLTTDENGQLSYENLAIGNYYFVETKAPAGYQLDASEHHFEIKAGETAKPVGVTVTNEADKEEVGSVLLTKTDAKDQTKVLAGAEFSLYNSDGKLIKDGLTTDENGQLSYENLAIGNYYFVETKAPAGYQLDASEHHFEIKAGETAKPVGVTVTNEADKEEVGSVLLTKTDAKDQTKVLAGAEFSLYNSDGKLIKDGLTTDENGQLSYENLAIGNYYFVETKAPAGYQLDASEHHFEIKAGETAKPVGVTVTNEADKEEVGSVLLTKTDAKDQTKVLAGAEFSLYNSDGKLIKDGLTTDENGQLSYENLAIGNYYFVETKAPAGYQLDASEHHFEIKAGETAKPVGVTVTNEADKEEVGSVLLTKTDAKDQTKVLAGAEFSLYNSDGKLIKDGLTTDENGQLSYENLAIGNYYFVETKAPAGYQLDASEHHFEIKAGETAKPVGVTVTNEADKEEVGSVLLTKTDAKDQTKVLAGAEFSLYNSDGKLIKDGLTTDENGQLSYENLAIGNYYFVETKAPAGYQLDASEHHFEIKAGETAKPVGVTVTNEADKEEVGSVLLTKTDAKDQTKVLAGAEFSLYNSDGKLIKDGLTTDENGQLSYENLAIGNYYFVETKAPAGYQLDASEHHFEIKAGETAKPVGVTVTNEADKEEVGSVLLTKTDAKDQTKVLAGAEFSLYNSDGKLIKDGLTTDENGQLSYENLAIGNYYFVETKAPAGYQLDASEHHFEIKAGKTAKPVGVTVTNEADKEKGSNLPKTGMKSESSLLVIGALLLIMGLASIWIRNRNKA